MTDTVIRFDDDHRDWILRATSQDRRYQIATSGSGACCLYTVIDRQLGIRGPMNVIGWGLGIHTKRGHDPAIDEAMEMLESGGFEVSRRGELPLRLAAA